MSLPKKPLKRHPILRDLSRDHQKMLLQARTIRWLVSSDRRARPRDEVLAALRSLWNAEILLHLQEEEEILIEFCQKCDGTFRPLARQIANDHNWLRTHIDLLTVENLDGLAEFGRCLQDHVRFEERTVFEHIQFTLSAEALTQLGVQLRQFRIQHRVTPTRRSRYKPSDQNSGT